MKKSVKKNKLNTKNVIVLNEEQMTQVKGGMKRFEELKDLLRSSGYGDDYSDDELMELYEKYMGSMG